ncbi:MAG: adenosine kinase [Nitrospinae bacterium]|nr:adenosine kinase [Nitrospinota bacterium]
MNYDVVGIGNALVDIQTQVTDEQLAEFNFPKGGMTLSGPAEQEEVLKKLKEHSVSICSGGSAANTIHGIGALGGRSYYFGRVANDEYGIHYSQDMTDCNVGFSGPDADDNGTGTSVVLITPDAQRTMITNLGISTALHPENVDETIIDGSKVVYIEGYLWTGDETRSAGRKVAELAKKHNIQVSFTLSDVFVVNSFHQEIVDFITSHVNILFCNEVEGLALAQTDNPEEAFHKIHEMCNTLFFTRGKDGVWASDKKGTKIHVKGYEVNAIDTTGAGDLFAAGALTGIVNNKNLEECSIIGNYCAAQVVTHLGARLPSHSHTDIDKIIKEFQEKE